MVETSSKSGNANVSVKAPIFVGDLELHPESREIYDSVMGKLDAIQTDPLYLLVHGPAGSGKTVLLQAICEGTRKHFLSDDACIMTAPTAIGSELLNSNTINSTFVMWEDMKLDEFLNDIDEKEIDQLTWMRNAKVLLIDIVNFVGAARFAAISYRLQQVTGNTSPFGGLSVILFGDFLQLKPIGEPWIFEGLPRDFLSKQKEKCPDVPDNLWTLMSFKELTGNYRNAIQEQNELLEMVRHGNNEELMQKFLNKHCLKRLDIHQSAESILDDLTELRDRHADKSFAVLAWTTGIVNSINELVLERFQSPKYFPELLSDDISFEKRGNPADKKLIIAKGCHVQLTHNEKHCHINNGSFGVVEDFNDQEISVRFPTKTVAVTRHNWFSVDKFGRKEQWKQFPLRLAYAFQAHRCQGITLDGVILVRSKKWSDSENWGPGEHDIDGGLYSSLSRARDLNLCRVFPLRWLNWVSSRQAENEIQRFAQNCKA